MLRNPASNSLPYANLEVVDDFIVRIFRGAQDELVTIEDVDKTGITLHQLGRKIDNVREHLMEGIGGRHAAADFMQDLKIKVAVQ